MDTLAEREEKFWQQEAKYQKTIELYILGFGYHRIGKILSVCKYLIRDWVHGYCRPQKPQTREERNLYYRVYRLTHLKEARTRSKKYYEKNRTVISLKAKGKGIELKALVLAHYSSNGTIACVQCGETDISCLSIDHIDGNGRKHRRLIGIRGGFHFYKWLKSNNLPPGYQTLCMNCQFKRNAHKEATLEDSMRLVSKSNRLQASV